jgi:hypothetical protein
VNGERRDVFGLDDSPDRERCGESGGLYMCELRESLGSGDA